MHDNKPIHSLSYGPVRASIWRNETANGVFHDVTLCRRFKDGDEWSSTQTFRERDLPVVAKAALDAHSWIHGQAKDQDQDLAVAFPVLVGSARPVEDEPELPQD